MALLGSYGTCFGPTAKFGQGSGERESLWLKFIADFSSDNTAIGTDDDIFIADHAMLIEDFYADVETTVAASVGTGVLSVGIGSGGTGILNGFIMPQFVAGKIVSKGSSSRFPIKVTRGEKVVLNKAGPGEAPTAGKIHLCFKVKKLTNY